METREMEIVPHNAQVRPGFIRGRGVIRDGDGNPKGEISFDVPATPEEAARLGIQSTPSEEET
jgi:hypothetical protein